MSTQLVMVNLAASQMLEDKIGCVASVSFSSYSESIAPGDIFLSSQPDCPLASYPSPPVVDLFFSLTEYFRLRSFLCSGDWAAATFAPTRSIESASHRAAMLAISDSHVATEFHVKYTNSKKEWKYIFVNNGFFDLISLPMVPLFIFGHIAHFYGLYLIIAHQLWTSFFVMTMFLLWAGFGVTAGSHRLWCHRSYRARVPLRIFLMIGHTMSGQYSIVRWSAGHRTHHKYADTDADPHNVKRGFVFSHLGWMVRKEHPWVDIKGSSVDTGDIESDPVAHFQDKYYTLCFALFSFAMPVFTCLALGESLINSVIICFIMRIVIQTHDTAFVNSAAHMFGDKPYNGRIASTENSFVSFGAIGEGYHNYHHVYPYDYAAGENGNFFNPTKLFIDVMCLLGQAYDLKRASNSLVDKSKRLHSAASVDHNFNFQG